MDGKNAAKSAIGGERTLPNEMSAVGRELLTLTNVRFFNRACLSRVGSSVVEVRHWLLCGSRFFTQSGAISLARCRHWSDRFGEPRFWSRSRRSRHMRLHPGPSSTQSTQNWVNSERRVSSCGHLDACGTEARVVEPHAMQNHGELASHRHHRTPMAADLGQPQAPRFER